MRQIPARPRDTSDADLIRYINSHLATDHLVLEDALVDLANRQSLIIDRMMEQLEPADQAERVYALINPRMGEWLLAWLINWAELFQGLVGIFTLGRWRPDWVLRSASEFARYRHLRMDQKST